MKRPATVAVVMLVLQACGSSQSSRSTSPTLTASVVSPSPALASPTAAPSTPAVTATGTPAPTSWPAPASLPAAGRILFTIERDGESHASYIDPAGFHLIPTANDDSFANAIWAPNDTIIFDSERAGPRHAFRMGRARTTAGQPAASANGCHASGTPLRCCSPRTSRPIARQGCVERVTVSKGVFCLNRSSGIGAPARRSATRHRGE